MLKTFLYYEGMQAASSRAWSSTHTGRYQLIIVPRTAYSHLYSITNSVLTGACLSPSSLLPLSALTLSYLPLFPLWQLYNHRCILEVLMTSNEALSGCLIISISRSRVFMIRSGRGSFRKTASNEGVDAESSDELLRNLGTEGCSFRRERQKPMRSRPSSRSPLSTKASVVTALLPPELNLRSKYHKHHTNGTLKFHPHANDMLSIEHII